MRKPRNLALSVFFCLVTTAMLTSRGFAQMAFNPALDQPMTPYAQQIFVTAFNVECAVYQQYNPGNCGVDNLIRNPSLQAWGLTTPIAAGLTVTRYNPTSIQPLDTQFGAGSTFFIFAHELGHHFDLQAPSANVPWVKPPDPPSANPMISMSWGRELRADAWAGCAMKRGSVPLFAAGQLTALTSAWIGPDVPPVPLVVAAISAGYNAC